MAGEWFLEKRSFIKIARNRFLTRDPSAAMKSKRNWGRWSGRWKPCGKTSRFPHGAWNPRQARNWRPFLRLMRRCSRTPPCSRKFARKSSGRVAPHPHCRRRSRRCSRERVWRTGFRTRGRSDPAQAWHPDPERCASSDSRCQGGGPPDFPAGSLKARLRWENKIPPTHACFIAICVLSQQPSLTFPQLYDGNIGPSDL